MEFSPRFRHSASSIFNILDYRDETALYSTVTLEQNNVYSKGIIIDISEDIVEIPVIARASYEREIKSKLELPALVPTKKIILPLYTNSNPQTRRTFDSIFSCLSVLPYYQRLVKINTSKGETYYGGKGILLDENMEPLMLCTLAARHSKITRLGEEIKTIEYFRPICHISPKVFGDRSVRLMEKAIIKKLIPFYSSCPICFPSSNSPILRNADSMICKVIIDNLDKFFIEPVKPNPNTCTNESLNQCLVDNIEDIIQQCTL